jgi:hypothetical protein
MPGGFPLGLEICNGKSAGSTPGPFIASTGTNSNTKGSWVTIFAATPFDVCYLNVLLSQGDADTIAADIGIGAAGQEKVIVANLMYPSEDDIASSISVAMPIQIPMGTRIAARCQWASATNVGINVNMQLFDGAFTQMEGCAGAEAVGFDASATNGTTISSPSSSSKGSYAPLATATPRDYIGFWVVLNDNNVSYSAGVRAVIDIAVGASGQEKIIVPDAQSFMQGHFANPNAIGPFWTPIPAGTRVSARMATDAGVSATAEVTLMAMYL